jgi:hypothetical protein
MRIRIPLSVIVVPQTLENKSETTRPWRIFFGHRKLVGWADFWTFCISKRKGVDIVHCWIKSLLYSCYCLFRQNTYWVWMIDYPKIIYFLWNLQSLLYGQISVSEKESYTAYWRHNIPYDARYTVPFKDVLRPWMSFVSWTWCLSCWKNSQTL